MAGKELVTALSSMSRRKTKGATVHVHLRVSHEMYAANHEHRGDPHHHLSSSKETSKKAMSQKQVSESRHRKTTFQTASSLKDEVFPIIGLQHDIARHAIERSKILHATRTHKDHSAAEVIAGSLNGNKHLQVINLQQNRLTNRFCKILVASLAKNNHSIKSMDISYNPGVGYDARPLQDLLCNFGCKETTLSKEKIMLEEEEKFNLEYAKIREKQNEILLQKMKIEESKQRRRNQIAKLSQDFVDRVIATSAVSLSRIDPTIL